MTAGDVLRDPVPPDISGGIYRLRSRSATSTIQGQLRRAGWTVAVVDLAWAADKAAIIGAFAKKLDMPEWFGHNWDALEDALRDLSWWPPGERGRVIILRGAGRATTGTSRDREVLADVLVSATATWVETASPLVVLSRH